MVESIDCSTISRTSQDDMEKKCHPSIISELEQSKQERDDALRQVTECQEGLDVWMECISLLAAIAGVDSDCYTNAFLHGQISCSEEEKLQTAEDQDEHNPLRAQKRLDELEIRWSFHDTALPMLLQSIHRLQSNGSNLRRESEAVSHELDSTKHELYQCTLQNKKLQKAVQKLYNQNKKLKEKLKQKKMEKKSLMKNVSGYVATVQKKHSERVMHCEKDQEISKQMKLHERLLGMKSGNNSDKNMDDDLLSSTCGNDGVAAGDRYDFQDSGLCLTTSFDSEDSGAIEVSSVACSSISSMSCIRSLVTDDVSSTVRLEAFPDEIYPDGKKHSEQFLEVRKRTKSDGDVPGWSSVSFTGTKKTNISQEILSADDCAFKGRRMRTYSESSSNDRGARRIRTNSDSDLHANAWSGLPFSGKKKQKDAESASTDVCEDAEEKSIKVLGSVFHLPKISLPHKETTTDTIFEATEGDDDNLSSSPDSSKKNGIKKEGGSGKENDSKIHAPSFLEIIGVDKRACKDKSDLHKKTENGNATKHAKEKTKLTKASPSFLSPIALSTKLTINNEEKDKKYGRQNQNKTQTTPLVSPKRDNKGEAHHSSKKINVSNFMGNKFVSLF